MSASYEEGEYVFCDLQDIFRFIRRDDPGAARRFLVAAYDSFEFLAEHPEIGRPRPEFGFESLRSWPGVFGAIPAI